MPGYFSLNLRSASYFLETNYVSELVHGKPDPRALVWIDQEEETTLFHSVIALAEIRKGVEKLATGFWRTQLERR